MTQIQEINTDIMQTLDRSNLLRGLLILVAKDKNIGDHEKKIFIREGINLGFDKEFCEDSIRNVLRNNNIIQYPPVFFDKANALKFIRLGVSILQEDLTPHPKEIKFLQETANANNLARHWKIVERKIASMNVSVLENKLLNSIYA